MIINIKHKALKNFYYNSDGSKLNPAHLIKIADILFLLNSASNIHNINAPGMKLHQLKGKLEGFWSVSVTGNYRIIFKYDQVKNEVYEVDLIDYH